MSTSASVPKSFALRGVHWSKNHLANHRPRPPELKAEIAPLVAIGSKMMLFADRVSAHRWWANQWRLLLSGLAYTLIEAVRRLALAGTELAQATCQTIRLKLLKIGTVIERKLTLIRLHFSSAHPLKALLAHAVRCLVPP